MLWRGKYNCSGGWQFNLKAVINGFRETIAYKESRLRVQLYTICVVAVLTAIKRAEHYH